MFFGSKSRWPKSAQSGFPLWMALLCLLLSGCKPQMAAEPLMIGVNSWPGYEFARLAREKGFYEAEGVKVRLVEFHSLAETRRAYERVQLDGMFSTIIEVLQVNQSRTRQPVVTMVTDYSDGADQVLARSDIKSIRGLRGARVGLEIGSLNVYLLARALETARLGLGDVTLINLPQNELLAAYKKGEIDAAVTYPPVSIELEKALKARRLFTSAEIPGEVLDVLSFEASVLASRGAEVRAVLRAYARAQKFAKDHPDEAFPIMAAQEGITTEEFAGALRSGIRLVTGEEQERYFAQGSPLYRSIEAAGKVMLETRQLTQPVVAGGLLRSPGSL